MSNLKIFLIIHFTMQLVWTAFIVVSASVWSGFTNTYWQIAINFALFYAPIQVIPFSIFVFLIWYFLNSKISITLNIKDKK